MQWSMEKNAGFSEGNPWLKVNPNYLQINVEAQINDENSILKYYQKLISLRKSEEYGEVFIYGDFCPAYLDKDKIYAFYRKLNDKKILVAANFGQDDVALELEKENKEVLLSNMGRKSLPFGTTLTLKSCEVVVVLYLK